MECFYVARMRIDARRDVGLKITHRIVAHVAHRAASKRGKLHAWHAQEARARKRGLERHKRVARVRRAGSARVAHDDDLVVGGKLVKHIPCRDLRHAAAPVVLPHAFVDAVVEIEELALELYPNPFKTDLIISYTLDMPSFVEVKITDIQGAMNEIIQKTIQKDATRCNQMQHHVGQWRIREQY